MGEFISSKLPYKAIHRERDWKKDHLMLYFEMAL